MKLEYDLPKLVLVLYLVIHYSVVEIGRSRKIFGELTKFRHDKTSNRKRNEQLNCCTPDNNADESTCNEGNNRNKKNKGE